MGAMLPKDKANHRRLQSNNGRTLIEDKS